MKAKLVISDSGSRTLEADGAPEEIASLFSLMEPKKNGNGHAPKSEYRGMPTSPAIADYLQKRGGNIEHTVNEIAVHFLGKELDSGKDLIEYNRFFARLKRAQQIISEKNKGRFISKKNSKVKEGHTRPYRKFIFEKNA